MTTTSGYAYDAALPDSPVSAGDLELLLATLLWDDADQLALRRVGEILDARVEDVLDVWYGFVGSHPHLLASFHDTSGTASAPYLDAVRARFGLWIRDLCTRPWDRRWLAYQDEIARRHVTSLGSTDAIETEATHVPLRYLVAFVVPITATIRGFLEEGAAPDDDVDALQAAWFKAVTLTVALWARPYDPDRW